MGNEYLTAVDIFVSIRLIFQNDTSLSFYLTNTTKAKHQMLFHIVGVVRKITVSLFIRQLKDKRLD